MDVVVVTWDGGSNSQPFEVICGALTARGDTVQVVSHEARSGTRRVASHGPSPKRRACRARYESSTASRAGSGK
jgi:hypothetical protein